MERYFPSSRPPISAVEVVLLRGIDANRVSEYMREAVAVPSVLLDGEAAQRVAALWRHLPPGEPYRCHNPPFGLRFLAGEAVVCRASLCWECNNIFGDADGQELAHNFDAKASVSRALLSECRRAVGEPNS